MSADPWIANEADAGTRLDKWLADATRLRSRKRAFDALVRGRIFVDEVEQTQTDAGRSMAPGMVVRHWVDRPGSASRRPARKVHGLDILFEDEELIVLNKPAGLLTVPLADRPEEPSLAGRIAEHWRSHRRREPLAVHRIDRDTTGVVVFAHTPSAWRDLKDRFARREPTREYLAVVLGRPDPEAGTWRTYIRWNEARRLQLPCEPAAEGAQDAVTRYEVVEAFSDTSLVSLGLVTGRQHQIRVQAMSRSHPLLGERIYTGIGGAKLAAAFKRQALHAAALGFPHPVSKKPVRFEAPLPGDLRHLLQLLRRTPAP